MNNLGIYLHVPFCKAKCAYCDFYSHSDLHLLHDYETALCRALFHWGARAEGQLVDTVYFGGGTPSLLSCRGLQSVFNALHRSFSLSADAEITVEVNPESATEKFLKEALECGVNRISMGMQSSSDRQLKLLGRLHCAEDTVRAVERIRAVGFRNLSLDLMYGLPGETAEEFRKSLEDCLALSPEHVSFYCLTLSENCPLYRSRRLLPAEEELESMYLFAHDFLEEHGYEHYEISNAARKGFRSRHNSRYWQGMEYLGIGAGAHSFFRNRRFYTVEDTKRFVSSDSFEDLICVEEELNDQSRLTEYVMLSLRRKEGIDLDVLCRLGDERLTRRANEKFSLWTQHGLCQKTERGFALTPKGFFVSNEIITELI